MEKIKYIKNTLIHFVFLTLFVGVFFSCKKGGGGGDINPQEDSTGTSNAVSILAETYSGNVITDWNELQIKLIQATPGYISPVAARTIGYLSLATYETIVPGMPGYQSLEGKLQNWNDIPTIEPDKKYNWGLAANAAQYTLMREIYATSSDVFKSRIDTLRRTFENKLKVGIDQDVIERSIKFGAAMATAVWEYSKTDGGHLAYNNNFSGTYIRKGGAAAWQPTGNQKTPLLPNWGNVRQFLEINKNQTFLLPVPFSFEKESDFFKEANEIYLISASLNPEQKAIADFWNDENELLGAAGHHLAVANTLATKEGLKLDKVAVFNLKFGLAMNDAVISSMRAKYNYNYMRPVTYIRQALNPGWSSLNLNSSSPDYTSIESTIAGIAATIMADQFGEEYVFEDNTYAGKKNKRAFKNFTDYASEASISQIYGGIHYRMSCKNGLLNGIEIAKNILALPIKKTSE